MKLEELVADLEHSRKVAPYVKDTVLVWARWQEPELGNPDNPNGWTEWKVYRCTDYTQYDTFPKERIPAPTLAELWAELPKTINCDGKGYSIAQWKRHDSKYGLGYEHYGLDVKKVVVNFDNYNAANAAADLLAWVMERK